MMLRVILASLFCLTGAWLSAGNTGHNSVVVSFYSESITLHYAPGMIPGTLVNVQEKSIIGYYHQLKKTEYRVLLEDLIQKKEVYRLNDWLYYELLRKTIQTIFSDRSNLEKELVCWFLLAQSGFDTQLTFWENEVFVYVYTQDEIYNVPMIEDNNRIYANLTSIHHSGKKQKSLYLLDFQANPAGKAFSFYLNHLPSLRSQPVDRTLEFPLYGNWFRLEVQSDKTVVDLMDQYPFFSEQQYLEVPLSQLTIRSLFPQLKKFLDGKSQADAVEFLVALTRSSFEYREDKEYFGKSKPMIAEEVFFYPVSDCEDRSALFFQLVRQLLDLPMIVIAYPDHLTIGVALPEREGDSVTYNGRTYYICDPTGPVNSAVIGRIPQGYEDQPFEIIGSYR